MGFYLTRHAFLKWLERPFIYHIKKDDLYELDTDSFYFLKTCMSSEGCGSASGEFIEFCLKEDLLTQEKTSRIHPQILRSPVPSLRYLEMQITNRCNLRCRHCYIGSPDNAELSVDQIRSVLKEFETMQGLRVLITGGEPLLHNEFEKVNEMLPDFAVRKVLFTNGIRLNKRILKKLHIEEIQISLDGLETSHDALRGKGTFRSAISAVTHALEAGFEVSVATMVHALNIYDFNKLEQMLKHIGIKDWTVDVPCGTGRLKKHTDLCLPPESGGPFFRYGFGEGLHSGDSGFGCGLHLLAVLSDGRIAKCTFFADKPVGTIREGLRKCWKKIKPVRLDELDCNCEHIESCRGGCRYRALLLGSIRGKDLYKCNFYDTIK